MLSPEDKQRLDAIRSIRKTNNDHWMGILELALEVAPERTKALLGAIRSNDEAIAAITNEIASDNRQTQDRAGSSTLYRR